MNKKQRKIKKEKELIKLEIAELIGKLRIGQMTINGQEGRAIIGADSLIAFLERIQKLLYPPTQ